MLSTLATLYLAFVLLTFALLFWAASQPPRGRIGPGQGLVAAILWFITLPLAAVIIYRAAKLIAETSRSAPSEPWNVWKPEEVMPGRWQSVRDHRDAIFKTRIYDNELVIGFERRMYRAVRFNSRTFCLARCAALNGGYATTVRDERSANPIKEDQHA